MIIDYLSNVSTYKDIHPRIKLAIEYLETLDMNNLPMGKTEISADEIFMIVSDSTLREKAKAKLEVHDAYIDIQIPLSKTETFGWKSRSKLEQESAPFDKNRDIQFFEDAPILYFSLPVGSFTIFYPQDAHAPCVGEGVIRKIVVKVKL